MFVYPVAIVCPFAYQPDDVVATTQHPLLFFLHEGELAVGQIIAYLLFPFHAEGDKRVSLPP